jgi:hypothetical protein
MRGQIIDTTRTVRVECDTVEIDGVDREIWSIVTRCPVNGVSVSGEYFATRSEAVAALDAAFA